MLAVMINAALIHNCLSVIQCTCANEMFSLKKQTETKFYITNILSNYALNITYSIKDFIYFVYK